MKTTFGSLIDDLSIFLNITEHGKFLRELPTNICGIDGRQLYLDYTFETEKYVVDYEFTSNYLTNDDLKRYQEYGTSLHNKYQKEVITYVISTVLKKSKTIEYTIGPGSKYTIHIIALKEKNLEKKYIILKNKIKNNEKINKQEMLLLIFAPFMKNKNEAGKILIETAELTNKLNADKDMKLKIKSRQIILTNRFVKDLNLRNKIKKVINMECSFINDFVKPGFDDEITAKLEKGIKKGKEQGKKEKEIEIIQNLNNMGFSTEKISEIVKIPENKIKNILL